jgi:hypothetical protein
MFSQAPRHRSHFATHGALGNALAGAAERSLCEQLAKHHLTLRLTFHEGVLPLTGWNHVSSGMETVGALENLNPALQVCRDLHLEYARRPKEVAAPSAHCDEVYDDPIRFSRQRVLRGIAL